MLTGLIAHTLFRIKEQGYVECNVAKGGPEYPVDAGRVTATVSETSFQYWSFLMIPRSYLYVPGNSATKLERATERGADALIVDLEDAVPANAKDAAREAVATWLADLEPQSPEIWVRVNPGATGLRDVAAVVGPRVRGFMLAKAESAAEVASVAELLTVSERRQGLPEGSIGIVPLLESGAAVLAARDIASAPRVVRLQVGEFDLAADLGFSVSVDEAEWTPIRTQTVLVSAAARIDPPVAPVSTNFTDLARFEASTRALGRMGFVGRACIHPAQVAVVNAVFTPSAEELERAHALVQTFDAAVAEGVGVIVGADGRMIDEAVVRMARRTIDLSR